MLENGVLVGEEPTAANTSRTAATEVLPVQHVDAAGTVGGFTMNTKLAGEDQTSDVHKVEQRFSYLTIKTATTTTVSGAGFLHAINIIGGTLGTIAVYDNTAASGTEIVPTFTPTATLPNPPLVFNVSFSTGLTIVTGAATIISVSYR